MLRRCKRKLVARFSPVTFFNSSPIRWMSFKPLSPIVPKVSMQTGTTWKLGVKFLYSHSLCVSRFCAAYPAFRELPFAYDGARVSAQVKSHTKGFPFCHGTKVSPSGFLPSDLSQPVGSSRAGILLETSDRLSKSLANACLAYRPALFLQHNPWRPISSTNLPQTHVCGTHNGSPSLSDTAILNDWLSSRVPSEAKGKAFSQAPEYLLLFAKSRAFDVMDVYCSKWSRCCLEHKAKSHACWNFRSGTAGMSESETADHAFIATVVDRSVSALMF